MADFLKFFDQAIRGEDQPALEPYPYQVRLAGSPIASRALQIPTGAGKTAATILSWLYRLKQGEPDAPRRLVYCLPMRVLVEQTSDCARKWTARVAPEVEVATLMGGEIEENWAIHPEKPFILIGTQDMLLSRALNRGYGMSRYRWAAQFGLLNNDCLWICDEVQLLGDGLATSTQLAAFRARFGVFGACPTFWMSATMDSAMLESVDVATTQETITLSEEDFSRKSLALRLHAAKKVAKAPDDCRWPAGLAQFLSTHHQPGTQTIAVVNRVARAQETYDELLKIVSDKSICHLLHSRFRPSEKAGWQTLLDTPPSTPGRILISTQVIEAGVDISSALLVTDLAPWPSLMQRFGRCNRAGELDRAELYWIDRPLLARSKLPQTGDLTEDIARPYDIEELQKAESIIAAVVSGASLDLPRVPFRFVPTHVLRRRDLVDLFDTTPDLSGYDLDVSRFIRSENDRDVLIAWREKYPAQTKDDAPSREELCSAPIHEVAPLLKPAKRRSAKFELATWDPLASKWRKVTDGDDLRPGMILIANAKSGGYDVLRGWDADSARAVPEAPAKHSEEEGNDDEPLTFRRYTQTLAAHSREVLDKMSEISSALKGLGLDAHSEDLLTAALYHDWGKAHAVFQKTVNPDASAEPLAKSRRFGRHERKHFRHELASALALLQSDKSDLSAYLAAAHHGKVRLSIRALPDEDKPEKPNVRFARGVHDGDLLPATQLDGITTTPLTLDLELMLLGMSRRGALSWIDRMLELRDSLGVFRLAYLEALIIAADWRASMEPKEVIA